MDCGARDFAFQSDRLALSSLECAASTFLHTVSLGMPPSNFTEATALFFSMHQPYAASILLKPVALSCLLSLPRREMDAKSFSRGVSDHVWKLEETVGLIS